MYVNHTLETVFGTIGAVLWSIQIIPQIYKSWKDKTTVGLSPLLMWIWVLSCMFLGVYTIVQDLAIPLQVQPQAFGFFATASWAQCLYYDTKRSRKRVICYFVIQLVCFAAFEVALVYALRAGIKNGTTAPITACGIVTAALLAGGLIPQYIEIYQLGEVIGISLFFLSVDMMGGVFSVISLAFREDLDILGVISYSGVVVLDAVVIILAFILNPRMERKRLLEKAIALRMEEAEGGAGPRPPSVEVKERTTTVVSVPV